MDRWYKNNRIKITKKRLNSRTKRNPNTTRKINSIKKEQNHNKAILPLINVFIKKAKIISRKINRKNQP